MSTLESALSLAARGFHVFPCRTGSKLPLKQGWQDMATTDPDAIRKTWGKRSYNIGISTSKFKDTQALVVVDVDVKEGKHGDRSLLELEFAGCELPVTLEHATPSMGRHLIYFNDDPCKQGVDVLGGGLDIRSRGGYILGPGSLIDGKPYAQINGHSVLAPAPAWLVDRLGVDRRDPSVRLDPLPGVDPDRARDRALAYLKTAPTEGDPDAYPVACKLKDLGCTEEQAVELMQEFWDPLCDPPRTDDTATVVHNAFKYGREPQGSAAPEAVFQPEPEPDAPEDEPASRHPFKGLNEEFAFVKKGAFVLQETTDHKGQFTTEHLNMAEFHGWHANQPFTTGKKTAPISQWWMEWTGRRQYEGVVFAPQQDPGPRWYNLWRGFRVEAAPTPALHPAVEAFKEHALVNVCGGDAKLCHWLMGYFAHMIQRPHEKPLVALVFKGKKGTGKNALVERVGWLLGPHFLVADDDRYLLSNFNAHLESNLFFVLDEAAWAGDKKAEGRLKGLITGSDHNIERKGKEPYRVANLTRVAIIGNEDWLVPATQDERRFAVFNLGDGRRKDRAFFVAMREGMEAGGYAHLLRYLQDFDLSTVDVNDAPNTQGLVEQKLASMEPINQWWMDCLQSGQLAGGDFAGEWPDSVPTNRIRDAYARWARGRNIRSRLESEETFGRKVRHMAPSLIRKRKPSKNPNDKSYSYFTPGLEALRQDFEQFIEGAIQWSAE